MTRIALISDIHFGKLSRTSEFSVPGEPIQDENTGGESLTESLVEVLKRENADYLCVAGDLTSIGSPQEFSYCEKAILSIAQKAGISEDRIVLGLGNHDVDWGIAELYKKFPNSSNPEFPLELVKEKYRLIAACASQYNVECIPKMNNDGPAPFSGIVEAEDFVMFILNSGWCCTNDQSFSHGKLNADQLEWFKSKVTAYKSDSRWKIVLMHHHPHPYSYHVPGVDISMLEECGEFLDIAGQSGIHLVMHGHRHHPKAQTHFISGWEHPITFICAGSLTVNSAHRSNGLIPNTVHIIELTKELGVLSLYNYQYSPAQGWVPIRSNCPETPVDFKMMLGKLFSADEIGDSVRALEVNTELVWDKLDESLRFQSVENLNMKVKTILSDTHIMMGRFPENVFLIEKRGEL